MTGPILVICMGVSSCGKTTIARAVADEFDLKFLEADDYHGNENRAWMAAGKPLTDRMREPWLNRICRALDAEYAEGRNCVLACSALRYAHRQRLRGTGFRTRFIFLDGSFELIRDLIRERKGHFMPSSLLESQFDSLERPEGEGDVHRVTLGRPWPEITKECLGQVRSMLE